MSHGDLKDFFGVEILEHCMDKYAKNEQRRLLWWKNEARRQEQRGAENFSAIEIAPKISQITGLYCSKIRTFTQGPGARCAMADVAIRIMDRGFTFHFFSCYPGELCSFGIKNFPICRSSVSCLREKLFSTLLFWWIAFSFEKPEHSQYIGCKDCF